MYDGATFCKNGSAIQCRSRTDKDQVASVRMEFVGAIELSAGVFL